MKRHELAARVANALNETPEHADVAIEALRCAFEINGKQLSYEETAWLILEARGYGNPDDPDVRYAAVWLKSLKATR